MSQATNCSCPCPDPTVVEIPGAPGEDGAAGAAGTNGTNAFTTLTANVTIPAIGANVTASVAVSSWAGVGQVVFLSDGTDIGHFEVISLPNSTSLELQFLGYAGDTAPGQVIGSGGTVSPSGTQPALAAPLPNSITDNSTGTASDTIAAGVGIFTLPYQVHLPSLTTSASELMTSYTPGFAFKILAVDAIVETPGTGVGATMTINLEINTTNLTGGVVNPTLANTATAGALIAGTAVTANNTGTASDTLSIEVAAGGTVFTAGVVMLMIKIQNMDTANAIASLADHVNDLITSLT